MGDFPASHVGWQDLEWSNHKRYRPHRGQATNTMSIKKVKNADRMKIPPGIMDMTWGLFRQDFFDIVFCCLCKSASQGMQFLKDIVKWIAARFLCVLRWVSQQCASPQWMLQLFQAVTLVTKQHFSPITSPFSRHFFDCWMLLLISLRSVASKQLRHVVSVCVCWYFVCQQNETVKNRLLSQVVGMLRNWTTHLNAMSFLNQQVSETHSDLYKYKDHLSKAVSIFSFWVAYFSAGGFFGWCYKITGYRSNPCCPSVDRCRGISEGLGLAAVAGCCFVSFQEPQTDSNIETLW